MILPPKNLNWKKLRPHLAKAHATLDRFNAALALHRKPSALFSHLSSHEMLSDTLPLNLAVKRFAKHPLSTELICKIHKAIKSKTPYAKEAGKLRTRQNWIGPKGCSIDEAYFYPPEPKKVPRYMKKLHTYLHSKEKDLLVQLAIYFAQLLIIHPFMDGNGRVARAIIPLFLAEKKLIPAPLFFMSTYFKKHRLQYLKKLYAITEEGQWTEWVLFFLKGIIEQGKTNISELLGL